MVWGADRWFGEFVRNRSHDYHKFHFDWMDISLSLIISSFHFNGKSEPDPEQRGHTTNKFTVAEFEWVMSYVTKEGKQPRKPRLCDRCQLDRRVV